MTKASVWGDGNVAQLRQAVGCLKCRQQQPTEDGVGQGGGQERDDAEG